MVFCTAVSTATITFWISRFFTCSSVAARCSTSSRMPLLAYQYCVAEIISISTATVTIIASVDFVRGVSGLSFFSMFILMRGFYFHLLNPEHTSII